MCEREREREVGSKKEEDITIEILMRVGGFIYILKIKCSKLEPVRGDLANSMNVVVDVASS